MLWQALDIWLLVVAGGFADLEDAALAHGVLGTLGLASGEVGVEFPFKCSILTLALILAHLAIKMVSNVVFLEKIFHWFEIIQLRFSLQLELWDALNAIHLEEVWPLGHSSTLFLFLFETHLFVELWRGVLQIFAGLEICAVCYNIELLAEKLKAPSRDFGRHAITIGEGLQIILWSK